MARSITAVADRIGPVDLAVVGERALVTSGVTGSVALLDGSAERPVRYHLDTLFLAFGKLDGVLFPVGLFAWRSARRHSPNHTFHVTTRTVVSSTSP